MPMFCVQKTFLNMLMQFSTNSVKSFCAIQIAGRSQLVFGGYKGGNSTKLYFSILAPGITTSACDVEIFLIYEAADSCDNMEKVLHPFYNIIKDVQHLDFCLEDYRIKVFLNRTLRTRTYCKDIKGCMLDNLV